MSQPQFWLAGVLMAALATGPNAPTGDADTVGLAEHGDLVEQGDAAQPDLRQGDPSVQEHWSFQPIRRPAPPPIRQTSWVRNDIDRFILARLESQGWAGWAPSPAASRRTLIRRLYLDLVGLPPTQAEVQAFLDDRDHDAFERVVDSLLNSPHYGERWARHWLDQARYADSQGCDMDQPRPHAWRYRHGVIDALNRDLPFNQFTIEQLAGDLLPRPTIDQLAATGFHRNALKNTEFGADPEEDLARRTFDRTNTTATVWLGLTLHCCRCHDHRYDLCSQRDYYG